MLDFPHIRPSATPPQGPATPAPAPAPTTAAADAEFSYNAQDTVVMPSRPTTIHGVTAGPETDKVKLKGGLEPENGKYVFADTDPRVTPAISFATAAKTVEVMQGALGQDIHWAFGADQKLGVIPDEGENFNAFYSRWSGAVHFFHGTDNVIGATIMSGSSGEVVSHEVGHAILDSLRPNYLNAFSLEPGAFHESFGDMVGLLMAMQDERSINRAVVQCGGDLKKPNCLAYTGEQLGIGINDSKMANKTGGDYVRNAINEFKWVDPKSLPDKAPSDQLCNEVHSFSRVWTGAFYELLADINADNLQKGMKPHDAIQATGQEGLHLLASLMKTAPQGDFAFRDMAKALLQADNDSNGGKRQALITQVYRGRNILPAQETETVSTAPATMPANVTLFEADDDAPVKRVQIALHGPQYGMFDGARVDTILDKDGGLAKDAEAVERTRANVERLIQGGRVKYLDPNVQPRFPQDYFNAQGEPYIGITRWVDGQMIIERSKVTA